METLEMTIQKEQQEYISMSQAKLSNIYHCDLPEIVKTK